MQEHNVTGILIVDDESKLQGILTLRDTLFEDNEGINVSEIMTKRNDLVVGYKGISLDDVEEIVLKLSRTPE